MLQENLYALFAALGLQRARIRAVTARIGGLSPAAAGWTQFTLDTQTEDRRVLEPVIDKANPHHLRPQRRHDRRHHPRPALLRRRHLQPIQLLRRYAPGASPCVRLNALAKANSEVYPTWAAMDLKGASVARRRRAAVVSRHQVR